MVNDQCLKIAPFSWLHYKIQIFITDHIFGRHLIHYS